MTATSANLLRAVFQLLAEEEDPTARLNEIRDMVDEWDNSPRQYAGRLEPLNSIIAAGLEDPMSLQIVDWLVTLTRPGEVSSLPKRVRRGRAKASPAGEPATPSHAPPIPLTAEERLNLALEEMASKVGRVLVGQERQAKARRLRRKWARELRAHPEPGIKIR